MDTTFLRCGAFWSSGCWDVSNPGAATSELEGSMDDVRDGPGDVCRPCCICSSGFFRPSGSAGTALGVLIAQVSFALKRGQWMKPTELMLEISSKSPFWWNQISPIYPITSTNQLKGAPEPLAPLQSCICLMAMPCLPMSSPVNSSGIWEDPSW
jgi:hypothetical protein